MLRRHSVLLILLLSLCLPAYATPVRVIVVSSVQAAMSDKVDKIIEVIRSADLDVEVVNVPDKRSIHHFNSGEYAMLIYRSDMALERANDAIRIEPHIDILRLFLWTADAPLCDLPEPERFKLTVAGVDSALFYPKAIYPMFDRNFTITNPHDMVKVLKRGRAQFTAWDAHTGPLPKDPSIYRCSGEPILSLKFYSFLHPNFAHLEPALSAAYKKHMPLRQDKNQ